MTEKISAKRLVLVGNPNAGKTTLFNLLTGENQHTGNWPGKTVERRSGGFSIAGEWYELIDLPGAYSLNPYSQEEFITRDQLLEEPPELILNVIDATNLERNLYLTTQLLEIGLPLIAILNMWDVASRQKTQIDHVHLSNVLGVPVIPFSARSGDELEILFAKINQGVSGDLGTEPRGTLLLDYGPEMETALHELCEVVQHDGHNPRWIALQLLEAAPVSTSALAKVCPRCPIDLESLQDSSETCIADCRYCYVNQVMQKITDQAPEPRPSWNDKIDDWVTHRWLGLPIFMTALWVVFKLTVDVSAPYIDWIDGLFSGPLSRLLSGVFTLLGLQGHWVSSLAVDGVLAGVGGVVIFVPVLFFLYLALAVLEDSGYMARAAFVMDRLMSAIGLNGRSFLPMMLGFGCSVPAIYATRTLSSQRDRLLTAILIPFMSCGARLPVYVFITAIFFPHSGGLVIFGLYLWGIVVAVGLGLLLRGSLLSKNGVNHDVLELPPYRFPDWRNVRRTVGANLKSFIRNAATIIVVMSIIIWMLLAIPVGKGSFGEAQINASAYAWVAGWVGRGLQPLGFGNWQTGGALIGGLVAKEVIISTLAQTYGYESIDSGSDPSSLGDELSEIAIGFWNATLDTLKALPGIFGISFSDPDAGSSLDGFGNSVQEGFEAASNGHGTLAALAFLTFILLYTPCMPTLAAFKGEFGRSAMLAGAVGQFVIAWVFAFIVYQGGLLIGLAWFPTGK